MLALLAYYGYFSVFVQLDDAARRMWLVFLPSGPAYVVDGVEQFFANVLVILCCGLSANVGTGANQSLLKAVTQFF